MLNSARQMQIPLSFLTVVPFSLLVSQLLVGTEAYFALMMAVSFLLTFLAINLVGGLASISGLCIAAFFIKTIGISQVLKVLLGQPADTNLAYPSETALVFALGFFSIFLACSLHKVFRLPVRLLQPVDDPKKMMRLAQASFVILLANVVLGIWRPEGEIGRIVSGVASYLQCCASLAVAGFAASRLIATKGHSIFSPWLCAAILFASLQGAAGASKQGMLEPFLAVFLAAVAFGYRRIRMLVGGGLVVAGMTFIVVYPLSQLRKNNIGGKTMAEQIQSLASFMAQNYSSIENIVTAIDAAQSLTEASIHEDFYFGRPMGVLDRLSLVSPADRLVWATVNKGHDGYAQVFNSIEILPRSITGESVGWKDSNYVGHKMGILHETDKTTGIAVTPFAHAWSMDSWRGILFLIPVLFFCFFTSNNVLGNELFGNIWAVSSVLFLHHLVVEATIGGLYFYLLRMFIFYFLLYKFLWLVSEHFDQFFLIQPEKRKAGSVKTS